jgi:hypothetical protein
VSKTGVVIPDGNEAIREDIPAVVDLIVRTARWVDPETFRRLPIWCPEIARGQPLFDAGWTRRYTNTKRSNAVTSEKFEGNVAALKALVAALDVVAPKPSNWTVCHIWGYDDPAFAAGSSIVQDPRYYSCVANMVWLPTALKAFTDALPEVKTLLRTCAFQLYGWACEHPSVSAAAAAIRSGALPPYYPSAWPSPAAPGLLPPGVSPFSARIEAEIAKRKTRWRTELSDARLTHYPRDQVREVLSFWKVVL